jgi:molybdenum cofactor biosynthesis enzyme MoaA
MNNLSNIGFYTLTDTRALNSSVVSPLWRCELILTNRCNFNCTYCRGLKKQDQRDLSFTEAKLIVKMWASENLQNIRFSGGEPTLWPGLINLVKYSKFCNIKRIAISTNGTANFDFYYKLYKSGVSDFSISLDACCASTADTMSGKKGLYKKIISNIKELSKLTYVTVGVVLTDTNIRELPKIINLASELGVSDVRIITAAQDNNRIKDLKLPQNILNKYPILAYRYKNIISGRHVRGLTKNDTKHCPLVLDDMAIVNNVHYPCIIYLREHGEPIGDIEDYDIKRIRQERLNWFKTHDCYEDYICNKNCLDVCIDYNSKWFRYKEDNNYGY